jgi:hypothetical protein
MPRLRDCFPGQLDAVTAEEVYRALCRVEPSLIRVEADECTYNLHVIVRFEIEVALLEGDIQVATGEAVVAGAFVHLAPGSGLIKRCPVEGCGGHGTEFEPPDLLHVYWDGDAVVVVMHINQDMTVKSIRILVAWATKDGRHAADAILVRDFKPPEEHKYCDTITVRGAWPSDFKPTGSTKPPAKEKLQLDKTKVGVLVNGQRIAPNQQPAEKPPKK